MNILGFSLPGSVSHDTSAAVVCDGKLVAAAEEERFSRKKHDADIPLRDIDFCLRRSGLSMTDIDMIAFPDRPYRIGKDSYLSDLDWSSLEWMISNKSASWKSFASKLFVQICRQLKV